MKKITLAKKAKELNSNVVLYAYTREGGATCGPTPPPTSNKGCTCVGNGCTAGKGCSNINFIC